MAQTLQKKVLVIDDDPHILELLSMLLSFEGYTVQTSLTGEEAEHLEGNRPDLILLDLRLNGKSGKDICLKLKSEEKTKDIPVILISAEVNIGAIAQECGANSSIPKPFDIANFSKVVASYAN
jgi:DNA-binding response OmpR family regulator